MKGADINQELDQLDALTARVAELEEENEVLRARKTLREAAAKGGRSRSEAKRAASRENGRRGGGRPSQGLGFDRAARQARAESRVVRVEGGWRAERLVPLAVGGEPQWWPIEGSAGSWGHANEAKRAWRTKREAELRAVKAGRS